jgi:membrane dipeptidase
MTLSTIDPPAAQIPRVSDQARSLLEQSLVWDNLLPWIPGYNSDGIDTILPRFRQVGVNFVSLTLAGGAGVSNSIDATMRRIARVRREILARSDWLSLATTVPTIRQARAENKLAVNFNFQETAPFDDSLDMIQVYYELGVRQALLAYNQKNRVGDGCAERTDAGLSRFGVEVIKEMNRVGMLVDGSHSGHRTTMEAMEVCQGPFIFSHSNPAAVYPHYRNIQDDQVKACAATGGIIGINGVGGFIGDATAASTTLFRCLDYLVELVGAEHVGIGLDYVEDIEGAYRIRRTASLAWPGDRSQMGQYRFAGPEQNVELVQMMLDHGYPRDAIQAILGENWARVCDRVWK